MPVEASDPFKVSPNDPCPCLSGDVFIDCCGADTSMPPRGVIIKKQAISAKKCDEMVKYFNRQIKGDCMTESPQGPGGQLVMQRDLERITESIKLGKLNKKLTNILIAEFSHFVEGELGKTLLWYQGPNVLLYTEGGWYNTHSDADTYDFNTQSWRRACDRDYSMLIYLSDKFEGGHIRFNRFDFSHKPQKGDLIFFPSDNRYVHTAEKVTSGYRYAIVGFCSTKESKKVQVNPPADAVYVSDDR